MLSDWLEEHLWNACYNAGGSGAGRQYNRSKFWPSSLSFKSVLLTVCILISFAYWVLYILYL